MRKPTVFICSSVQGLAIAQQFALQLEPSVIPALWSERFFDLGKTVTESLTEAADHADFAIFVLTNDDIIGNRARHSEILRQNIAFEMGFLAGRIGLSRIFVILGDPGPMPIPSDLTGVMLLKL